MAARILFFICLQFIFHEPLAQQLPFTKYTSKDGLISDRITAISQDQNGFMWFGSFFGISFYDGIRFRKIDLPARQANKYVNFIASANGKTYAGFLFNGGLMEYDHGKTKSYFAGGKDSASINEFTCLYNNGNGKILLANTVGQVYEFENGIFKFLFRLPLKQGIQPRYLLKDDDQAIWVGTESGLFILPVPYKQAKQYYAADNIFSLARDKDRILFCRTNGSQSSVLTVASRGGDPALAKNIYQSKHFKLLPFAAHKTNGIWGVDMIKGLTHIRENSVKFYDLPLDLNTDISAIYSDRENNIWIANEPGIVKVSNFNIQTYLFDEIAAGGGDLFIGEDSVLWASNSKALYSLTGGRLKKINLEHPFPYYYGLVYRDRSKKLWIGFWNEGLLNTRWMNDKAGEIRIFSGFNNEKIKSSAIAEDHDGNTWVAGANGIFHIRQNQVIGHYKPSNVSGQPSFISCMALDESSKTLWIGDNALGLVEIKYEQQPDGSMRYTKGRVVTSKEGLGDMYIRSLLVDHKKNLWIGTRSGGIFRMSIDGPIKIENLNTVSGITCTRVTDMVAESQKAIWFATCNGIYRFRYEDNNWTHFGTGDGLLNAEVFNLAVDAKNDFVWALTSQGLTRFSIHPEVQSSVPLVSITSVNVLGKPDSAAFETKGPARFGFNRNSIGFEFAGASFIDEKNIRYQYMLEGFSKEWSMPVSSHSVNYASLAPGHYHFKVKASNAYGQWSLPASYEFEIVRPFYQSPWFIFFLLTVILLIIYLVRIQQLKQRFQIEKIRLNIARDLHDDIGSTLGSINIMSKTAARKLDADPSPENIAPLFRKIGTSAENTMEAMDDIVWSINPDKDKLDDLVVRMREFAIPLLEAAGLDFKFETSGNGQQSIPMNLRRNAFLVFKESIHNVLKHSGADWVVILLKINQQFVLSITDDGKGFDAGHPSGRNGLKNMKARALSVGGTVVIESTGKGTAIKFTAPLR